MTYRYIVIGPIADARRLRARLNRAGKQGYKIQAKTTDDKFIMVKEIM